ncbi:MAG TPA: hypothetical protein VH478_15775 [Trebonia sp.]|jgi:hypothetical protein|nr:hypothetical protein [Trebonia sp.]
MRAGTSPHGAQLGPYAALDLHRSSQGGKGLELEDGWLIEVPRSARHNWVLRTLAWIVEDAAGRAGASATVVSTMLAVVAPRPAPPPIRAMLTMARITHWSVSTLVTRRGQAACGSPAPAGTRRSLLPTATPST